jgi:hypothetical protein
MTQLNISLQLDELRKSDEKSLNYCVLQKAGLVLWAGNLQLAPEKKGTAIMDLYEHYEETPCVSYKYFITELKLLSQQRFPQMSLTRKGSGLVLNGVKRRNMLRNGIYENVTFQEITIT